MAKIEDISLKEHVPAANKKQLWLQFSQEEHISYWGSLNNAEKIARWNSLSDPLKVQFFTSLPWQAQERILLDFFEYRGEESIHARKSLYTEEQNLLNKLFDAIPYLKKEEYLERELWYTKLNTVGKFWEQVKLLYTQFEYNLLNRSWETCKSVCNGLGTWIAQPFINAKNTQQEKPTAQIPVNHMAKTGHVARVKEERERSKETSIAR
jgi:hypothetical protein